MKNSTATGEMESVCTSVVYKFTYSEEMSKSSGKNHVGHTKPHSGDECWLFIIIAKIMKNCTATGGMEEVCTNVVCKFRCSEEMSKSLTKYYVEHTETTLWRRMLALFY